MSKKSESTSRGDSLDTTMTSLKVAVRVRPLNDKEINLGSKIVVDVLGNDIVITDLKVPEHQGYDHRSRVHKFSFDYGFSSVDPASEQYASQATVFENFGRVVLQALLEGYNCCVIAYGQSGSGKTYTMMGMKDEEGLTPRICEGLLMKLEDEAKQNISFAVNISYMEIYNEQVYDLLQKPDDRTNHNKPRLRVREHPIHGPFVEGLSTHVLKSRDNVCQLISEGNFNRVKAATYIHERSSRSHAIFTVHCSQACLDESQPKEVVSKLQLVDLAGSEKAGHEFCQSRLKEGANINKSLVTLGNVISALVELSQRLQNGTSKGGRQLFVPYRDSQLTWLMKDSLGGNSHTFMLAAVSPSKECYSETLSTLRYAQRAKNVLSIPVVNEDPATKIIRNLRYEVNKLKSLLINADVLSKREVMKPLPDISHLNSIMKNSEKKVDHLTRCWFEKWLETYNTVVKKTNYLNEEPSDTRKGTVDILQKQKIVSGLASERTDTILCDFGVNYSVKTNLSVNSLNLKAGDSDTILSDKSSSVSSECIILPNEIIFYSKGKRNHAHQDYFNNCKSVFKNYSANHVGDANHESIISAHEDVKSSSTPAFQFPSSPAIGMSLCNSTFKSLPVLNYVPVSTSSVRNSVFIHDPLFRFCSLPKDIQTLPESIEIAVETEKVDLDSDKCAKRISNCFQKTLEGKKIRRSDEVLPNVGHYTDCSIHGSDVQVKSNLNNDEFLQQKDIRNDAHKDYISILDHNVPVQPNNASLCVGKESHDNQCTNAFSTADIFTNCKVIANGEINSCEEIQFNDSVAEESENFVKLLNRIQHDSGETINHCFQRTDSEILSLLSLSSNDYLPFHSLDDFLDDDVMGVPDETSSVEFDVLSESKEQSIRKCWDDSYSSPDVTDESESSDAESEFDYVDFTKNAADTCSKVGICNYSSALTTVSRHQNLKESKFLRQTNSCKENLLLIPENATVPRRLTSADASVHNSAKLCNQAEDKNFDMNSISSTATVGSYVMLKSRNSSCTAEISHELSPFCNNTKNQLTDNSPVLLAKSLDIENRVKVNKPEQRNYLNHFCGLHEVDCGAKISDNRKEESFTANLQKKHVFQKRLCNSDSILKALPNSEVKYCSQSDNTIYVTSKECQKNSDGSEEKKNEILDKNDVKNDSYKKTLVTNKDSVSDFLDFSVQDILDMINDKGAAQHGALFKNQICSDSEEEKLQHDSAVLEEIQKFIDSTEITDANKLASELLKKKISECPAAMPCALTSSDLVLCNHKGQNKNLFKSEWLCSCSDTDSKSCTSYCEEGSKQQDSETLVSELDIAVLHPLNHREQKLISIKKEVPDVKQNPTNVHCPEDNATHKMNNVSCTAGTGIENINCPQENGNLKLFKNLHMATEKVCYEKENALEIFTLNGCKEFSLNPMSNENDYLDDTGDLMSETKKSSKLQQINAVDSSRTVAKDSVLPEYSARLDTILFNSHFHSFVTASENGNVNDSSSQINHIFTDCNSFGNLNITSLTPIQEEVLADGDDVVSDVSEDDSPNISFQFDSLERPKNTLADKKCTECVGPFCKTDTSADGSLNTAELQELGKLTHRLSDVPQTFCNKNSVFSPKTYTEIKKQDQHMELSNSANQIQSQDSQKNEQLLSSKNSDMCIVTDGEIDENDKSLKNNLDLKINDVEEANNVPNQLFSWDSSSSATSSDSITFVFVGKENKDVPLDTNSRSFQSSLFSSVSLDSLEKSSVHQNQTCISPRTLSIDSLVAEELLFQLRNSDPIQPLASKTEQCASSKCEMNNVILADQNLAPTKTNFAATSQLSCNQHLKMYHHAHYNMENDLLSQDVATRTLELEKYKGQNVSCAVDRNQTIPFPQSTFPLERCSENESDNQPQNLKENHPHISTESNGDISVQSCSYLKTTSSNKHQIDKNCHCIISDDSNRKNLTEISSVQNHILENENVFSTCASATSHYTSTDFGSHYGLDLQNNNYSSVALNDDSITASTKSLDHSVMNNYNDILKQVYLPENISSKDGLCDKIVKSDHHDESPSVKELTEENLKIFNSEYEENQGEILILPPPSTFDVSEDSMISNFSSISSAHCPSKPTANVFSKSTQTDQTIQNGCNRLGEKDVFNDPGSKDLIVCMMDLMVETLKLMKEQYARTPKKAVSRTRSRRKLHFSSDMTNRKKAAITMSAVNEHENYIMKERGTGNKVTNCMQSVLPVNIESTYVIGNSNYPLSHSERLPLAQKNANENSFNVKNKADRDVSKNSCSRAKKPNFYTLPFDFITCKYQGKKLPGTSKFQKADAISETSVDCLPDKSRNSYFVNNEFNNLSTFNSISATEHKLSGLNEMLSFKQSHPKLSNSKNHLKHLIEVRRKVVEETMGSLKDKDENVNDPLKSPSSSSEGYLSSVSSRGPFRQLSEVSTDSQESGNAMEHLFSKQCFLKHSVRPLDFSNQYCTDVAASPGTRRLNTSADSGAFFLDSPGTEKKTNLDEYPNIASNSNDLVGTVSSRACTSSKMIEKERSSLHNSDNLADSINPKNENVPLSSKIKLWNETKYGGRQHRGNNFARGFQDLDEIGENYLDISSRKSVSVNSSTSSDFSLCARPSRTKCSTSSRASNNSSRLKRLSSQEIQKLLESIENDRRLLREIQHNNVFDRKYSPSHILSSSSSFESSDDLFYQDSYKALPSPSISHNV